jgi:hypothetical protein
VIHQIVIEPNQKASQNFNQTGSFTNQAASHIGFLNSKSQIVTFNSSSHSI